MIDRIHDAWTRLGVVSTERRNLLVIGFSALSVLCWLVILSWYSLYGHRSTPHFALDKVPDHFQSPTIRYTLVLFVVIPILYFVNYCLIATSSKISTTIRWTIAVLVIVCGVINVLIYPVGALDVFHYLTQLKLTYFYDRNPYLEIFAQFAEDPYYPYAFNMHRTLGYPPFWLLLSRLPTLLSGFDDMWTTLLVYKLFNLILIGLTGLVIYRYQKGETDKWAAAFLFLANPLILFEGVANGHNDVMMAMLLTAAALALRKRSYWVGPLLVLSVLAKLFSVATVPVIVYAVLRDKWRGEKLVLATVLSLLAVVAVFAPFWARGEMIGQFLRSAKAYGDIGAASPFSLARELLRSQQAPAQVVDGLWYGFAVLFVISVAVIIWRLREDRERALVNSLLMFNLLLTTFYPWYLIPVIAILALKRDKVRLAYLFSASTLSLALGPVGIWAWFEAKLALLGIHLFGITFNSVPALLFLAAQVLSPSKRRYAAKRETSPFRVPLRNRIAYFLALREWLERVGILALLLLLLLLLLLCLGFVSISDALVPLAPALQYPGLVGLFGVLVGAMLSGYISYRIHLRRFAAKAAIERKQQVYEPLYAALLEARESLRSQPYPAVFVTDPDAAGDDTALAFLKWTRITRDSRYVSVPRWFADSLNQYVTDIDTYLRLYREALEAAGIKAIDRETAYAIIREERAGLDSVKRLVSFYEESIEQRTDWLLKELAKIIRYIGASYEGRTELF
jgi:hypothetical protein